ncbi:phosphodiester glycosidase family protein [Anaerotalea alkaliphila]|uniref:Phosphodiester glycosidase family protein n=1 Tax=Anaerotalea alkaliphila TaxID=2662126 RepID=A0A7X5KMX5_9FIRM|nr:phosphodiester glycosidase family protein [Anaerotalea alkaliphila]NDL68284.1 phosphodiester glycosidase family protein [Anaerotalea alkaliphila]
MSVFGGILWVVLFALSVPVDVAGVRWRQEELVVNGRPQRLQILEVDQLHTRGSFENVFSHDQLFGYEALSSMTERQEAWYGVNGMFYDPYGTPYGTSVAGGVLVSNRVVEAPVLQLDKEGKASLGPLEVAVDVELGGNRRMEPQRLASVHYNSAPAPGQWALFTPDYARTNRIHLEQWTYGIRDGRVASVIYTDRPVSLGDHDFLLTYAGGQGPYPIQEMDPVAVSFRSDQELEGILEAFQTGGYLVRDGRPVAKNFEKFMGHTTAPSPRTLVGITPEGKVRFLVLDGRLRGASEGVTGVEAARILLEAGCVEGAYLDGGASTTLVRAGTVLNHPSNEGMERAIGHGILVNRGLETFRNPLDWFR